MKKYITYNNGFGKVLAEEKEGAFYVKRSQWLRAWQKVTQKLGGLTELEFDTDKKVIQIRE